METVWVHEYSEDLKFYLYIPHGGTLVLGYEKPKFVIGSGGILSAVRHDSDFVNRASILIEKRMNEMYPVNKTLNQVGYDNYGRILSAVANRAYNQLQINLCSNIKTYAK